MFSMWIPQETQGVNNIVSVITGGIKNPETLKEINYKTGIANANKHLIRFL